MRLRGHLHSLRPVRSPLLFVAILASALIVAPVAQAAYVKDINGEIYFSDYYGEANQVTVTDEDGDLVFRDAAAPITVQDSDCTVTDGSGGYEVRCPGEGSSASSPEAWLGGGDDRVRWESAAKPLLNGQDGNDELDARASRANAAGLRGGEGDDRLIGADRPDDDGDGRVGDGLEGGPGADVLEDSDGTNRLSGDEGDDFITGGFGEMI